MSLGIWFEPRVFSPLFVDQVGVINLVDLNAIASSGENDIVVYRIIPEYSCILVRLGIV